VFFDESKRKDIMNFRNISNEENVFPNEIKRLIYVALSRPKYLLAMAFPESITNKELKAKFGEGIKIIGNEQ